MLRHTLLWVLVGFVLVAGLLLGSAITAQPQAEGPIGLDRAIQAQEKHTKALMAKEGVVGTAVGKPNDRLAIIVFVVGPKVDGIPKKLDGVPVVKRVTGEIFALRGPPPGKGPQPKEEVDRTARFERPVPIGVSTGHPDITAGTIGARVTKGTDVYALSNNHVYAAGNNAITGDNVLQPGTYDGGINPDDEIGTLSAYKEIMFDGSTTAYHPPTISRGIVLDNNSVVRKHGEIICQCKPVSGGGKPTLVSDQYIVGTNVVDNEDTPIIGRWRHDASYRTVGVTVQPKNRGCVQAGGVVVELVGCNLCGGEVTGE